MLPKSYMIKKIFFVAICIYSVRWILKLSTYTATHNKTIPTYNMQFLNKSVNYTYTVLPNLESCRKNQTIVLATVLSSVKNYQVRQTIRETWASANYSETVRYGKFVTYFILGRPSSNTEWKNLRLEQEKYHDLIITDIEDSYQNLIYKSYAALAFHRHFCSTPRYLLKIDDDVGLLPDRLLYFMEEEKTNPGQVYCRIWDKTKPIRLKKSKWYVPQTDFKEKIFPKYCNGPAYLVGKRAIPRILESAKHCQPIVLEDTFFTGIVAERARVRRVNWADHFIHPIKDLWRGKSLCDPYHEPLPVAAHSLRGKETLLRGLKQLQNLQCATKVQLAAKDEESREFSAKELKKFKNEPK